MLQGSQPAEISTIEYAPFDAYDWRALKRWNISEDRLPSGSQVRYKTVTFWETYKVYIIGGIGVICLETILIYALFISLMRSKRIKETLQESEERYRTLQKNIPVGVFRTSNSGKFLSVNPAASKLLGLDAEEDLSSYQVTDFYNDPEKRRDVLSQLKTEGKITDFEVEFRRKDGSPFWGSLNATQVTDKDGNFIFIDGVVQDITERKQAEEELKIKDSAIASSISAIGIADLEGTMMYVNDSLVEMWGYESADEILGRNVVEFWEGEGIFKTIEALREKGGRIGEDIGKRKDGSVFDVQFSASMIKDEAGTPLYMFGSFIDISERKEADQNYRIVADFTYDWEYWITQDGTLKYVSPSCERVSRYSVQDFMDNPSLLQEIVVPEDAMIFDKHLHDSRKELQATVDLFRLHRRDGEIRWIEHACQPVTDNTGRLIGFRASNRDITARKMAEIELRGAYTEIEQLKNQLEAESAYLQDEIKLQHNFENIVGQSEALKYVLHRLEQVAPTNSPVLIMGETGTGEEIMARALHRLSHHGKRALVKVNCAALPGELIESELFGREKGAFTGATTTQPGRFELAKGSTLFLDEIGELPLRASSRNCCACLKAVSLKDWEARPHCTPMPASSPPPTAFLKKKCVKAGFREDLWYRLKVFPITVPPLRERTRKTSPCWSSGLWTDSQEKWENATAEIPKHTMQALQNYPWPGNVRELEHAVEGAIITAHGKKLNFELPKIADAALSDFKSLEEMERDYILQVLEAKNWKIGGEDSAASTLGMHVNTLRARMKKLGIQKPAPK